MRAFTPVITPFREDGTLAPSAFRAHVERLAAAGIGIYVAGTGSGEAGALTREEMRTLMTVAVETVHGRVPVRAFPDIDWSRTTYEPVAGGDGQVVIRVLLYRPRHLTPAAFLMEIQKDAEPGWHVGYFAPDRWYKPRPGPGPLAA